MFYWPFEFSLFTSSVSWLQHELSFPNNPQENTQMIIKKDVRNMKTRRRDLGLYRCESLTPGVPRVKNIYHTYQVNWKGQHFRDTYWDIRMVTPPSVDTRGRLTCIHVYGGQNLFMDKPKRQMSEVIWSSLSFIAFEWFVQGYSQWWNWKTTRPITVWSLF